MGCDIHLHTEVKIDGKWEHYGHPRVPRNYYLFSIMANVRNSDGEVPLSDVVSEPRGLPEDMSIVTRKAAEDYMDGHSHSWLGAKDLVQLEEAWRRWKPKEWDKSDLEHHFFGYLEGNSWAGFTLYPKDRPGWIEDVRFVFWFDN